MSLLEKYLAGFSFRTNKPVFESGDELVAFVTDRTDGEAVVRIGDSLITLDDADGVSTDTRVKFRVDSFDANDHVGRGTLLEIGESGAF